jgi:hypothetical protein
MYFSTGLQHVFSANPKIEVAFLMGAAASPPHPSRSHSR